jgi:hypothetical protein
MNVYQIISEKRLLNAGDLAKAFSQNEWQNIIVHFNKDKLGSNAKQIRRFIDEVQRQIGHSVGAINMSPEQWNNIAVRYNMSIDANAVTWQGIYSHLAPHAPKSVALPAAGQQAMFTPPEDTDLTDETKAEVSQWVSYRGADPMGPGEIETYIKNWLTVLNQKRDANWISKLNGTVHGRRTPPHISMRTNYKKFVDRAESTPVPKSEIDTWLYSWLNTADYTFKDRTGF